MFLCLGSLILSFTYKLFAYFKFHSDWGRVTGKIKQNELDCRDTASLNYGTEILLPTSSEKRRLWKPKQWRRGECDSISVSEREFLVPAIYYQINIFIMIC